jgi:chromate reductase, NAD(P)H dehydrogenase (quinone)
VTCNTGEMPRLIAVSGSLRAKSFNTMLARAAIEVAPADATIEQVSIRDLPLYDGDVEAAGIPPAVTAFKDRIAGCDGMLIVTPEYNNGIPGVLKNAIDWASRPPADTRRVFADLPVAVIGATPGPGGTLLSQAAWLPVLRTLGTLPFWGARLGVSQAGKVFDDAGAIVDPAVRDKLADFVAKFSAFVARNARAQR